MAALGIGPSIVGLDAGAPAASELIVATGLHAGQPAVDIVIAGPEERSNRRRVNKLPPCPQAAGVATDVAAGPGPYPDHQRRRRRRLVDRRWPPQVGRYGRRRDNRSKRDACEETLFHLIPL